MSTFLKDKFYIQLRAIERGLTYGIYPGDLDGDGADELLLLGERYAYLMKIYDLKESHVEMREYIPDPANIELYVPKGGAIVDFDGDGRMEIALAITLGTGTSFRVGFKNLRMSDKVLVPFKINGMAYGDIDGDGIPEFVMYGDSEGAKHNIMVIKDGKELASFLEGLEVFAASIGDVNGDGRNEIVLSMSESDQGTTKYYLGIYSVSGSQLNEIYKIQTSREIIKIRVSDLDKDGIAEIYVMSPVKVSALRFDASSGRIIKMRDTPEGSEALRDFISDDFDSDGYIETLVVTDKRIILYEHGIPENMIEEEVKSRGFTCVNKTKLKDGSYIVAGLDDGIRFGKLV